MPASVDEEDEYAVGPAALLQPGSAAALATLGVRPGGRAVHGGGAQRAIAIAANGADAALVRSASRPCSRWLRPTAGTSWSMRRHRGARLVEELRGTYDEVFAFLPTRCS